MFSWELIFLLVGFLLLVTAVFNRPPLLYFVLAFISFGIFYYLHNVGGLNFILFAISVFLLVVEFYIPDFGLVGLLGILGTVYSLYQLYPDISVLILLIVLLLFAILLLGLLYSHQGKSLTMSPAFVLKNASTKQEGYQSHKDFTYLLGEKGMTDSILRPVGRAIIEGEYFEVMSEEHFIDAGTPVVVVDVQGANIYVRKDEAHV